MKRIKQELIVDGFVVHTKTKEQMKSVVEYLDTVDFIEENTNPEFWRYYEEDTILDINNYREKEVYYSSIITEDEMIIYDYEDIWEYCDGFDAHPFKNGGTITIIDEEEEKTKVEKRIEELEQSIWEDELKLHELKVANKYSNMSMEISNQLSLINKEKKLLKGYETLDDMEIGNVIINNETVIVISLYGKKAISKLSDGDKFNFLAGFFLCLTKLGSAIDTDWYNHSIHAALEDIELGNL